LEVAYPTLSDQIIGCHPIKVLGRDFEASIIDFLVLPVSVIIHSFFTRFPKVSIIQGINFTGVLIKTISQSEKL
jgi:hypothetical protein